MSHSLAVVAVAVVVGTEVAMASLRRHLEALGCVVVVAAVVERRVVGGEHEVLGRVVLAGVQVVA